MNLLNLFNFPEQITLFRRQFSIYFVLGHLGFVFSFVINGWLCVRLQLPLGLCGLLYGVTIVTFYGVAWVRKILLGYESYVLLRYTLLVNLTVGATLGLSGVSKLVVFHFLDLLAIAVALLIAFGRLGCQTIGCCQGKPCRCAWYVAYPSLGAQTRIIRLIPIQLIESAYAFGLAGWGVLAKVTGLTTGAFWVGFWLSYTIGRYLFEFFRGDADRPYRLGFSEAQWTGAGVWLGLTLASYWQWIPWQPWQYIVTIMGLSFTLLWALVRSQQKPPFYRLTQPAHLQEFIQAALDSQITAGLRTTSLQLNVTVSKVANDQYLYSVSHARHSLPKTQARRIFRHLQLTLYPAQNSEMQLGGGGVYHWVVDID